jgi:PAS domain-containing protein
LDDKGMILYESPSAERIVGQKPEQVDTHGQARGTSG